MKSSMPTASKIALWALNPFEQETRPSAMMVKELISWAETAGWLLQPVHVVYVSKIDAPPDYYDIWIEDFVSAVVRETQRYLEGAQHARILTPKILTHHGLTLRASVDVLTRYAYDAKAVSIIVSSKGRTGLRRMALGSFSETLLVRSPVPVWVFGPNCGAGPNEDLAVLPTAGAI